MEFVAALKSRLSSTVIVTFHKGEKRELREDRSFTVDNTTIQTTQLQKKVSDHTIQCLFQAIYLSLSDSFGVFSVPTFSFIQVFLLKVASIFV